MLALGANVSDAFVSVDVETSNPDLASICQVGVVTFAGGQVVSSWWSYVDPQDYFDPYNTAIHGLTEESAVGAPTFAEVMAELEARLAGGIVVCHAPFNRIALSRATERYHLPPIACTWLDSARVARRAWPNFSGGGYGLTSVAAALGVRFTRHVGAEDARATGEILLQAVHHSGLSISEWLDRVGRPINDTGPGRGIAREGNPDGPLAGDVAVFTGALLLPRKEAAKLAAMVGCNVEESVNKRTTLLIVGDQDIRRLAGHEKSSKHRKAEHM